MKTTGFATALAAMAALCFWTGMVYAAPSQGSDFKGKAYEWDFTKGVPSGGKPRKCAVVSAKGLSPQQRGLSLHPLEEM